MSSHDSARLVNHAANAVSRLVESDTEVSTVDLNLLENLNTNQSLNYIKLEQSLGHIENNTEKLVKMNAEYQRYQHMIGAIDESSQKLESMVKQMDAWCADLEGKIDAER